MIEAILATPVRTRVSVTVRRPGYVGTVDGHLFGVNPTADGHYLLDLWDRGAWEFVRTDTMLTFTVYAADAA